jgi:hypothetical protein
VRLSGLEPETNGLKVPDNPSNSSEKQHFSDSTGPKLAPRPTDSDLETIVAEWSSLPEAIREAIVLLVRAALAQEEKSHP